MLLETSGREFKADSLGLFLTAELPVSDPRIIEVKRLDPDEFFSENYLLIASARNQKYSIVVSFSAQEDSFAVWTPLRDDAKEHSDEGVSQLLQWWSERDRGEEGILIDFAQTEDGYLTLGFDDQASAFCLEIVGDLIDEIIAAAPDCFDKLVEIFGPTSS